MVEIYRFVAQPLIPVSRDWEKRGSGHEQQFIRTG
jgi:hypothetical protein